MSLIALSSEIAMVIGGKIPVFFKLFQVLFSAFIIKPGFLEELYLQISMIKKYTHVRKQQLRNAIQRSSGAQPMNLPLNLMTADDVQILCMDTGYPGVLPRHGKITAGPRNSRALANPMGRSPWRFAKKAKAL